MHSFLACQLAHSISPSLYTTLVANFTRKISGTRSHTHRTTPFSNNIYHKKSPCTKCVRGQFMKGNSIGSDNDSEGLRDEPNKLLLCGAIDRSVAVVMHGVWTVEIPGQLGLKQSSGTHPGQR